MAVAERCHEAVGGVIFAVAGTQIALTASVGVARYPAEARDSTELVQAADRALYAAKAQGRGRVPTAGGAPVPRRRALHDAGKVGVPERILTKPGPLTPDQWDVMRDHVRLGVEILRRAPETEDVAAIVGDHHERVDGNGVAVRAA